MAANRPDSRPWMCVVMCVVWLSGDIWSVADKAFNPASHLYLFSAIRTGQRAAEQLVIDAIVSTNVDCESVRDDSQTQRAPLVTTRLMSVNRLMSFNVLVVMTVGICIQIY